MHDLLAANPHAHSTLEWPMPIPFLWVWLILIASFWWGAATHEIKTDQGSLLPRGSGTVVVAMAMAGRLAAQFTETTFYVIWWKVRGRRLPFWRMLMWLISLSVIDLIAENLMAIASHLPPTASFGFAPVAGFRLFKPLLPSLSPGVYVAFGSLGLLTASRVVMTAVAQSRAMGMRLFSPLILTASTWFVTRILVWWCIDLARGMSPLP